MSKTIKPLTQADLDHSLNKFWTKIWEEILSPAFEMLSEKIDKVDLKIDHTKTELKAEIKENRRLIHDLQIDTPTRAEFNRLKKRVDHLESPTLN